MRYFAELAYKGTQYAGWQNQPNATSVQQVIENALSTILRSPIAVVGCGRTDAGVHASQFFLHFDFEGNFPKEFIKRLNKFLPKDIVFRRIFEVKNDAHARFDATKRSYVYLLDLERSPFHIETAWYYFNAKKLNVDTMNEVARLLLNYKDFTPFCKSNSDAKTMLCNLHHAEWIYNESQNQLEFYISANRFLRGMVRLIVGACVYAGEGRITVDSIQHSLENQLPLTKSYSVPAHGLYLCEVVY